MTRRFKVLSVVALALVAFVGVLAVTAPVAVADCQPVACPAIAKICPQGQIACHPSPCSCALACQPEGVGCNS